MVSWKTLIIRPGLIVGPRDETDRFTYWPVRIDRGGEVMAPGSPNPTIQSNSSMAVIWPSGRSGWSKMAKPELTTRPGRPNHLSLGGMLDGIKSALNSKATFTWVDEDFL